MLHPPFVLWPHSSSNARGQDCSWLQYQQCCNCQEAADSGAGGVETTAVAAGEAAGVCTILMRDPELRMYAGVAEVELKSSAVEPPPTTTTEALVVGADSLTLSTSTTSSTMITVQIPQSSPLSRTSPPPLLSPPYSVSSSTMSLSSSLVSSSEATKDLPAPTAVTMTITAAKASTAAAATNASTVAVSNLHQSSSRPVSTHNPVSSSSVAPLLTTTMMMMMSSPLSSTSSLRRSTSSVHNWFQSELDMRGIESVYSRYIISLLLQRDKDSHEDGGSCGPVEGVTTGLSHLRREPMVTTSNQSTTKVIPDESKGISCVNNTKASLSANARLSVAGTTTQGRRQKGVSKREKLPLSEEESKKREAVQCLLEVCDEVQAGGIEKLIEELMLKLKELEKKESTQREAVPISVATTDNSKYVKQDPAERYYAAFPALSTDSSQTTPTTGSPSTVIPGSDNSNVWKKKLQQQQEQQQQQLQHQKQQQLMQRKRQFHQVKADKKSHYQSVSSINCSGTSASIPSCTKENKFQTKSRRNGNIHRRNDATIRVGTRSSHTHHGNKENVQKKTESNSLTTRYGSARNRHHNSSFYPLHMVSMKQSQQRTGSGKSKLYRTLTCDVPAEMQPLTSHTVTRQHQQLAGGNENLKQGQYYHRKMGNYNNSDYKSSICSDREGQKYCIIVENILKDILLSSNEKRPALVADRDPYSTSRTSHWLMQDRQFQHAPDALNQQDVLRNQLAARPVALNQTAPQSVSILDPPSPTGSSPLFLLDEINYSYYDQSFRDMKWRNEEINPVPNVVCEAFREDASWYESNFEDPFDTVRCSPVACTTVAEVPSISSVDSNSKLRARLYKRHNYPLSSPSSLDDIQSYTEDKTDNFSMLLGPFVETQPPIYPSEKVDSCVLSTSSISNEPVDGFCHSEQVASPVAESNHCDKNLMAVTNEKLGNSPISYMVTSGLNCNNDALLTTMTSTNLWSAVTTTTTTTSSNSQTVSYTSQLGENLPKSYQSASCLTTEPSIENVWSFPGHLLVDIQPPQPATAVTSIVLTPQLLITDSEQGSVPTSSIANVTFTTTSTAPSLLSTCATGHSYLSPRHPSIINTESGKVNTSSVCSSTVNTPPSSTSPCSTSSLSLVDLSYLTHIAECDSKDPSSLSENTSVSSDQKQLNINSENTEEDSEILDTFYACTKSLPGNTWKDADIPALSRSPVLTPGHYPDFLRDSQVIETPENYMTALYKKLDSDFSAELFAQDNEKWPEQLVFDMRLLWQDHQLQYKKESFGKSDTMLSTIVDPFDGKSISLPDFSIINQLWCQNCGKDSNIEEGFANPDEFLTKSNCFSQLWNINRQKRLAMSSQPIPQHHPYSNICSYSPQQLKHNPFTLFLPTVGSVDTTSLFSPNTPSKIASLPPISSFLHDNTSLFSPVSIFPSAAVITNNNNNNRSKQFGNWDYFCCNYYSFYSSSPTGPFSHQQNWPSSSSSFFSSPLLSPPLSNSSFMFPLASYSRDFYQEKPIISLPIKVLPTTFVPHAIESAKRECPSLVDVIKGDDNLPSLSGIDKTQDSSELAESDATIGLEDRKKFSEIQTSTLPSPPSSAVSIVTSPVSSSTVSSTSPCLLSSSPSSLLQTSVMGPFQASELIPSECSAFKDVIPRKQTVMAELSETLEDNKSKSLEEEEELVQQSSPVISPHEMLYFSPRTHFRPIKTPPDVGIGHKISLDALNAVTAADLLVTVGSNHAKSQRFIPENISAMAPILYQPPDLFGGHPECQSPYQDFHQAETIENKTESVHPKIGFVPKFRLHRNTDKYIQTGMSHSSLQEESLKSTQFHLSCQQPNESFVDYDLEKLAEEVCSEDNIRDCTVASDVEPLSSGFESDFYMTLCTPEYVVSDVGGAFSSCERNKINNAASIWSYDNQSESAGTSSTPSPWGRDNIDSSTTNILGLMASDAKNHYPKTWSRGSDEIPNWTPVAVTEAINWTPIISNDSWPIAVSSSTSSCSSAALDPGSCIHVFSQPASIADDAHRNPALNISGHVIKEEQWPNNQENSKSISMMSSHNSPLSGIAPPFNTISCTNHLSKIPISDVVCSKSELWQQQQQNTWINSQKAHTWESALPLTSEAVNPTMWDSNDGCGDTGADHWMLESPGTEDSDWTSETPVHKTSRKQMWPKPEEVVISSRSSVNKDSSSTSLLDKSWSVDDAQIDELDWYFSVTSAMKIKETKKALMDAAHSQQVWEGNLLQCPVSCGDTINSGAWFNKPLIYTPKFSIEQKDWPRSKDCMPETSLSASSYLTTDPLLAPLSLRKSNTWFAASEKPCYWPGKYGNENMNEENTAKKWLSVHPHEMSYDKITNQGYHENNNCKPENIGEVKDIDIYKKKRNDTNNANKNNDCCKDIEIDNLAEELSALNCEGILKKTGTEWLSEKSDHIDWTSVRDMSEALSWPAVPSQASISCSGDHCQEPLLRGWLHDYTLTSNNANFKATTVVTTGTEKVGPLNWAEPRCMQKSIEKSANRLTLDQTDKTLAVSSKKVMSSNVKKSYDNLETLVPLPWEAVYSSELEKEWLNSETSLSSSSTAQLQEGKEVHIKSRSIKKPCSFFLEGNCRRTECKFSHDISTITCRFWEDGECFKGDTCPFLHGYYATATLTASATTAADKYKSAAVGSSSDVASASTMKELSFLPQSKVTDNPASGQTCV